MNQQVLLGALKEHAPPLAMVDAAGTVWWSSEAFTALFETPAQAGTAPTLAALAGDAAAAALMAAGDATVTCAGSPWRLRATPAAGGWLISAEALADVQVLRERLELVQEFTRTGVFERDPRTLEGRWDRTMFEIWGLPEDPQGRAPAYADTRPLMFSEDTRPGAFGASLHQPGPHRQRVRIRRPDGQVRHLNTQWRVLFDHQHQPRRVLGVNTDDTDAFELGQRAARLSAELDVALKVGGIGLWRLEFGSDRVVADERGCEIIGVPYTAEGLTLDQARARIHPDDVALAEASAERTLRTGEPTDMQLRYPAPGGGWRHVLLRRALQRDVDGKPLRFVGVLMDVTERVEEARRAREVTRRLESAAEAARVGLWSAQANDRLPNWNRLMYEIFGLDPAGGPLSLDDWLQRCVPPAERQPLRDAVMQWWLNGSGEREFEIRIVRPADGATRWIVLRGRIDAGSSTASRRIEGVAQDITEQHQTLRQLRETVERSALTTRALGLGTWSSDIERKHVIWDAQMFRLRGIESPAREISPEERRSYVHPDDRDAVVAAQNAYVRDGEPWRDVFRVCWPDGQVRWITSHSIPLRDEHGQIERRIGVNWDSTEAHLAAQALREREVAVAESHAKSQAMSRISHELRTPLNAILGFTQLLRGSGGDSERRAAWLALVEDASRHLLALIDDVLELSRAQVGEIRLAPQAVACAPVIHAALALVAGQAQARHVRLLPSALDGVAMADPLRLRQVMVNLLSNAIKYNRPGGEVRVWVEAREARLLLHVADTGIGIAPERLSDAFEPFNRLGAEATAVEGSGIGLAIVKVLVELMEGRVSVHSDVGVGSRFSIDLPAAAPGSVVAPPPVDGGEASALAAIEAPAGARVLYIEDNPVNALLVRELLAQRPALTLHVAADGASGIRSATELQPALVLIDMQLPDMDGHAVLRALRADPRTAATPCVVLSANATADDLQAAADAGFDDYWTKPIDLRHFLEGVDRFIGRAGPA